jgi:hypothetical protein
MGHVEAGYVTNLSETLTISVFKVGYPRAITDICIARGEYCSTGMKQNKCNNTKIQEVWASEDRHENTSRMKWPSGD